jgi:hypothetical protein
MTGEQGSGRRLRTAARRAVRDLVRDDARGRNGGAERQLLAEYGLWITAPTYESRCGRAQPVLVVA